MAGWQGTRTASFLRGIPTYYRAPPFFYFTTPPSTVTKAEVIAEIAEKTGIDKSDVSATIEKFFEVVRDTMAKGDNIYVRGFGSFVNKKRARKVARNISKNTAIIIDEHFVPSFKPSKEFVKMVKESESLKPASVEK